MYRLPLLLILAALLLAPPAVRAQATEPVGTVSDSDTEVSRAYDNPSAFFDDTERTLSYTLTPPPAVTAIAHLVGRVSFDGSGYEIFGSDQMTSTDATATPTLAKCQTDGSGKVHLELTGVAGQVGVLQSSPDLVHWQDVTTLYLPDGAVQFDDDASGSVVRYYRLQIR